MDGYAVARALRVTPGVESSFLIALSGYAQAEDQRRARAAGFDCHVPKPASFETLEVLLSEAPATRG
jgi:CheY-like chemotaxis protein